MGRAVVAAELVALAMSALARFRELVHGRGKQLRELPIEELRRAGDDPVHHVTVSNREGTIGVIVQLSRAGALKVVIQGFLKGRFMPVKDVAIDGFYKYPDGTVADMSADEFYEFD